MKAIDECTPLRTQLNSRLRYSNKMQSRVRFPISSTSSHDRAGDVNEPFRKNALEERLKDIVVLELKENGGREYHNMTLRGLVSFPLDKQGDDSNLIYIFVLNTHRIHPLQCSMIMSLKQLQVRVGLLEN